MRLKSKKLTRILMVMVLAISMFSITAFADTNSVSIVLHDISDNTDTVIATYTRAQLNDTSLFTTIDKHNYSTYTCKPSYQYYTAKGPELQDVFTKALTGTGYTLTDVGQIDFVASDDYEFSTTKSVLLDTTRYWYNTNHTLGGTTPAILATSVATGLNATDSALSVSNTFRDFYGQTSATDYTALNLVKNVETITIYAQ